MRFMMIVKGNHESEAGVMPSKQLVETMTRYNDELVKSGVLLAADGLHPTSRGFKKKFVDGKPTIVDGPFSEAKEIVAGYWILQVKSRDEMLAWAMRCPAEVEVRQIFDNCELPDELREASAGCSPEAARRAQA
jgi:hypothetical protein